MRTEAQRRVDKKNRIPLLILVILLTAVLITVIVLAIRQNRTSAQGKVTESTEGGEQEKWQEGVITYNGRQYKYNNNIHTYLLMGIDKEGPVEPTEGFGNGGQSDAMFLIVTNSDDETISVISINRNTMTRIHMYGATGDDLGTAELQICLQHAYGDGMQLSCSRTVEAVSHLFYGLPIDGYLSINLDAIPVMNDTVGGTTVTVLNDISYPGRGVDLHEGEVVTLNGEEAYWYIRGRDVNEFDSATYRLRRQEQFITAFTAQLKGYAAGSVSKAVKIYDSVSEYLVTSVDFVDLITELMAYEYDDSRMYTVPGETVMGETYEEYYVDDDALYDLIIQVFYEEVEPE